MLFKVLIVVIGFLIYIFFFKKSRQKDVSSKKDKMITDDMVECERCKTFVSLNEAIVSDGKFYCSKDCLNNK